MSDNESNNKIIDDQYKLPYTPLINEEILFSGEMEYCCSYNGPKKGKIFVTNYRLMFIPTTVKLFPIKHSESKKLEYYNVSNHVCYYVNISMSSVIAIEKSYVQPTYTAKKVYYSVKLDCLDGRIIRFVIPLNEAYSLPSFIQSIDKCMKLYETIIPTPTLKYKPKIEFNGWDLYNVKNEYHRIIGSSNQWFIDTINRNYLLCETYPENVIIHMLDNEKLSEFAMLFSRNRFPIFCWQHPYNHAPLLRSGHPVPNLNKELHMKISSYFNDIIELCPLSTNFYIIDTQYKEDEENLFQTELYNQKLLHSFEIIYLNIPNIHVMRDSLFKLHKLCNPGIDDSNWINRLESTKWLEHIHTILNGTAIVVDIIERQNSPVLVMCHDGWDRTPQVISLAMLCLDPFYRTINGLACLIEKEWCSIGHKFSQRNGFFDENKKHNQQSPIFLQFIECIYHILNRYQHAFEYNEDYLIAIVDGMYSRMYGTFLSNSEKMKSQHDIVNKTTSLWSDLFLEIDKFKNPLYLPSYYNKVILPKFSAPSIKLWKNYYMRYNPMVCNKINPLEINSFIQQKLTNLENIINT